MKILELSRRQFLTLSASVSFMPLFARAGLGQKASMFAGINLSGAEFGSVPGVYGRDYLYPSLRSIKYFRRLGFNLIRLPFLWERLQPDLWGPFVAAEQSHLAGLAGYLGERQMQLVLDPHNYARRKMAADDWRYDHLIGSAEVPTEAFVDFWTRLASLFRGSRNVIFGVMNEPYGLPAADWFSIANRVIAGIRTADAANLILVPGTAYTGAHSWIRAGNGILAGVRDPANNYVFEVHEYLDEDSSGAHPEAVSPTIGSERIRDFEAWAREHKVRAFLGEFGASANEQSLHALSDLCRALTASPDVWAGWSAWSGGPWWPRDYMFNLEPLPDGKERQQTEILASFARQMTRS
jgi:endoglucanase